MGREEIGVEEMQDTLEKVLMENDPNVAKAYILYRKKREEIRTFKASLGIADDELKMPINSLMVLAARYLVKDENGKVMETPKQLFTRVANTIAAEEAKYGMAKEEIEKTSMEFYDAMTSFKFMPNSPTLMNAGTRLGQLSACFVLPMGDSIDEIFDTVKWAALVHKSGGGTGFSVSRLRPANDMVRTTGGVASGPISFLKVIDAATEQIKQGGKRRGANMGILRIDHPDILNFIVAKESEGVLSNFNISVGVTEEFMKAVKEDREYNLLNPRTKKPAGRLNARAVWNLIVTMAWKTGDPGLVFLDRINSSFSNPVPSRGPIEATNPCITGDTMVYTSEGAFTAEKLHSMGRGTGVIVDSRFGSGPIQAASPVFKTGIKDVVKLSTKQGYTVRLTTDHRVYSDSRGWVEAGKLEIGERIRISDTGGAFGTSGTESEGRILGWLVGDGHINHGNANNRAVLSFYGDDSRLANMFSGYVNDTIRASVSSNGINTVNAVNVRSRNMVSIASERLKEYVAQYGLVEEKLQVPERVFCGSIGMQRGFLQALFEADGTVGHGKGSRNTVRLTSISEELLRKTQMLLLNFGVYSKIYRNRKDAQLKEMPGPDRKPKIYHTQAVHELAIDGANIVAFMQNVGFLSERKNQRLYESVKSYTRGPYKEDWVAEVSSIEQCGTEEVYDLIEPNTHSFVANGIVVHNCGEQPLYPFDSCNLASINLARMVKRTNSHYEVDWEELRRITRLGVRFLDNVIDANKYPLPQIDEMTRSIRRIGLGIMGWADMLIKLGIRYDSNEALALAEKTMSFITENARTMSEELAEKRGAFPEFENSIWYRLGYKPLRNSTVTTIAPTGTISIISGGASQGVEPIFSIVYMRNVHESLGYNLIEVNNEFERYSMDRGFYSEELMKGLAGRISIQDVEEIPEDVRELFLTAHDIAPEWHVKMQAAFQKYVDNGVSKTINFPNWATPQDIEKAYRMAYDLGCKGITVYRDGSKSVQVLQSVDRNQKKLKEARANHAHQENKGASMEEIRSVAGSYVLMTNKERKCDDCGTVMVAGGGCMTCPKCGFSLCE